MLYSNFVKQLSCYLCFFIVYTKKSELGVWANLQLCFQKKVNYRYSEQNYKYVLKCLLKVQTTACKESSQKTSLGAVVFWHSFLRLLTRLPFTFVRRGYLIAQRSDNKIINKIILELCGLFNVLTSIDYVKTKYQLCDCVYNLCIDTIICKDVCNYTCAFPIIPKTCQLSDGGRYSCF